MYKRVSKLATKRSSVRKLSWKRKESERNVDGAIQSVGGHTRLELFPMASFTLASSPSVHRWLGALSMLLVACTCPALTIPADTAIPVVFTKTVNAAKAKAGDPITAKTIQAVRLPDGENIPKGSRLTGHIVQATSF